MHVTSPPSISAPRSAAVPEQPQSLSPPRVRPTGDGGAIVDAAQATVCAAATEAPSTAVLASPAPVPAAADGTPHSGDGRNCGVAVVTQMLGLVDDASFASYASYATPSEGDVLATSCAADDLPLPDLPVPPAGSTVRVSQPCGMAPSSALVDGPRTGVGGSGASSVAASASASEAQLRSPSLRIDVRPVSAASAETSAPACASRDGFVPSGSRQIARQLLPSGEAATSVALVAKGCGSSACAASPACSAAPTPSDAAMGAVANITPQLASPQAARCFGAESILSSSGEGVHTNSPLHRAQAPPAALTALNAGRRAPLQPRPAAPACCARGGVASHSSSSSSFHDLPGIPAPPMASAPAPTASALSPATAAPVAMSPAEEDVKRSFYTAAAALGFGAGGARGSVPLSNTPSVPLSNAGGAAQKAGPKQPKSLSARIMRLGASDSEGSSDEASPQKPAAGKQASVGNKPKAIAGFTSSFGLDDDGDSDSF